MVDLVWIYVCDDCDTQCTGPGECVNCGEKLKPAKFYRAQAQETKIETVDIGEWTDEHNANGRAEMNDNPPVIKKYILAP